MPRSLSKSQLPWDITSNAGPTSDSMAALEDDKADLLLSRDPPRGKKLGRRFKCVAVNPFANTTLLFLFALFFMLVGDSSNNGRS